MTIQTTERVALNKLTLSTRNVRTNVQDATDTADLQASILAHGLLNPLVVIPAKGKGAFEVVAGGRRLRALEALVNEGHLPADTTVPVVLAEAEAAEELSLAENFIRKAMRPYEIYRAFTKTGGGDASVLADRFGITEARAKRILRLGNLLPDIFEAYATGEITEEQAQAFAATEDRDLQAKAWDAFGHITNDWERSPRAIRNLLGMDDWSTKRDLLAVGEDAYLAAGGRLERDLFGDGLRILDPGLLADLVEKARQEKIEAFKARCTRPVRIITEEEAPRDWSARIAIAYEDLDGDDAERLAELTELLESEHEEDEFAALDAECDALLEKRRIIIPEDGDYGLCFDRYDRFNIYRLDSEEDDEADDEADDEECDDEKQTEAPAPEPEAPQVSKVAVDHLSMMRRERLIERSTCDLNMRSAAIRLLLFIAARQCFSGHHSYEARGFSPVARVKWSTEAWMQEPDFDKAFDEFATVDIDALAAEMIASMTQARHAFEKNPLMEFLASWSKPLPWQSSPGFWDMFNKKQMQAMVEEFAPPAWGLVANMKVAEMRDYLHDLVGAQEKIVWKNLTADNLNAARAWVPAWLRFKDEQPCPVTDDGG